MAKIEFSQGFMSGLPARILKNGNQFNGDLEIQNLGLFSQNVYGAAGCCSFRIFKGTKPTIASLKNETTARSVYSNDCLLRFEHSDQDLNATVVENPINVKSIYKPAIKSDIASWFYMSRTMNTDKGILFGHTIVGDVGLTGSGADLELPDLNIVAGNLYRIDNFKINLPSSWEY